MKEDRISQLPDPLICQILSHLPTKQLVQTSVLCSRWRNLWLWVPSLKLYSENFQNFNAFKSFGDRFFDSNRVAYLQKLDLRILRNRNGNDVSYLTSWMDAAAKRKIQHLEFSWLGSWNNNLHVHTKHLRLYKCVTLVHLKLKWGIFDDVELVSFPCLKTMHLRYVKYPNVAAFEKLVSRCPVLEELKINFLDDDNGFQLHSQSLKRLILIRLYLKSEAIPGFVIDAPLLCCLGIFNSRVESFVVNNMPSNAKLTIAILFGSGDFDESRRSNIRSFLSGISRVGDMTIAKETFQSIFQYSKVKPLPQFGDLSRLDARLYASDLKCLPTFLESCPNLKSLHLSWEDADKEMSEMNFSSVPKCLQSSLEFINIAVLITEYAAEMKIVRYFLENSTILKKFTLSLQTDELTEKYIREDLHKIPRGSTKCEVHVVWPSTNSGKFYNFNI